VYQYYNHSYHFHQTAHNSLHPAIIRIPNFVAPGRHAILIVISSRMNGITCVRNHLYPVPTYQSTYVPSQSYITINNQQQQKKQKESDNECVINLCTVLIVRPFTIINSSTIQHTILYTQQKGNMNITNALYQYTIYI